MAKTMHQDYPFCLSKDRTWGSHYKALAGLAHSHLGAGKVAKVGLLGWHNPVHWHEAFPNDLLFDIACTHAYDHPSFATGIHWENGKSGFGWPLADESFEIICSLNFHGSFGSDVRHEVARLLAKGGVLIELNSVSRIPGKIYNQPSEDGISFPTTAFYCQCQADYEGLIVEESTILPERVGSKGGVYDDPKVGMLLSVFRKEAK